MPQATEAGWPPEKPERRAKLTCFNTQSGLLRVQRQVQRPPRIDTHPNGRRRSFHGVTHTVVCLNRGQDEPTEAQRHRAEPALFCSFRDSYPLSPRTLELRFSCAPICVDPPESSCVQRRKQPANYGEIRRLLDSAAHCWTLRSLLPKQGVVTPVDSRGQPWTVVYIGGLMR